MSPFGFLSFMFIEKSSGCSITIGDFAKSYIHKRRFFFQRPDKNSGHQIEINDE